MMDAIMADDTRKYVYSIFGITVDRSHALKWLFSQGKATLHSIKMTTRIPKML